VPGNTDHERAMIVMQEVVATITSRQAGLPDPEVSTAVHERYEALIWMMCTGLDYLDRVGGAGVSDRLLRATGTVAADMRYGNGNDT
jgi:hypothetical protein